MIERPGLRRAVLVALPFVVATVLGAPLSASASTTTSTSITTATSTTAASPSAVASALAPTTVASPGCLRERATPPVARGTTANVTLTSRTVHGNYSLSVPASYLPKHPTPLIVLFYGDGDNPADFSAKTNFPAQGAAAGDLVAVPQNQGPQVGFQYSPTGTDAAFVSAAISSLERTYCVNERAIFTTGFSSGAAFSILYACAHQRQIRAIASVSVDYQLGCTRPEPILAFHGTADPAVTYQPNTIASQLPGIRLDATSVKGTLANMADWVALDRCTQNATSTRIGSQVVRRQWRACAPGTSVTFYTVLGGGHEWPGAKVTTGVGLTTQQISANTVILAFFNSLATA